jgi:hypothetical protein
MAAKLAPFLPFNWFFLTLEIPTAHYEEFLVCDIKIGGLEKRQKTTPTGAKFVVGRRIFIFILIIFSQYFEKNHGARKPWLKTII